MCFENAQNPPCKVFLVMLYFHADLPFQKIPPLPSQIGNWQREGKGPIYAFAILREIEITSQSGVMRSLE